MPDNEYNVAAILRACRVVRAFRFDGEVLGLAELAARTGLHKATAFRTIQSLVAGGLLERVSRDQYRNQLRPAPERRIRVGYAAMAANSVFSRDVTEGLRRSALARGIDLVECDNRYSPKAALRNAEMLVKEKVDAAIEVQIHEHIGAVVATKFQDAGIPLIAVDIPHPGAVFFGGNNYLAGRIGGRALGKWAQNKLGGEVDLVVLLGLAAAGSVPAARITGITVGIKEVLPDLDERARIYLDGKGGYVESMKVMRKFLSHNRARRVLVGAMNDASALGALRALEESGVAAQSAVVGQNATAAARAEIRRPGSHMIGSVAFFPEQYGAQLMSLALELIQGKPVPRTVFVKHVLITAENVDSYYPNDALIAIPDADSLLWNFYH